MVEGNHCDEVLKCQQCNYHICANNIRNSTFFAIGSSLIKGQNKRPRFWVHVHCLLSFDCLLVAIFKY
jgi:hypothetical protein